MNNTNFSTILNDFINSNNNNVNTNDQDEKESNHFHNPVEGPAMLTIGIFGSLCNLLCLAVLRKSNELKLSPDYIFLLRSQSVFDLLYLLTSTPVTAIPYIFPLFRQYAMMLPWLFPFVQITMTASIYTTIALAVERYLSIREPNVTRQFPCVLVLLLITVCSFGLNVPRFFELRVVEDVETSLATVNNTGDFSRDFAIKTTVRYSVKPTADFYTVGYFLGYNMIGSFIITLFIPVVSLIILNTLIWKKLKGIYQNRSRLGVREKRNYRAALSLVFVVILFFFCHSMKLVVSGYQINFDQWLMSGLKDELSIKEPNYRIVRRRVVWLIGQWSGVKLSPELRPKLYEILLPLLERSEDLVVRLAAAKALKVVIDDFEFSSDELQPFLPTAFNHLFFLLKEVQECDTKLSVLNVLSYVIERVGVAIRPLCGDLLQYLPALWEASEDHNMLRCSILNSLVYIVHGLGTISATLAPFLFPVIKMSTDLTNPSSVYLLEDGLELWLAVLHNTKVANAELFELADANLKALLELGSEHLRTMIYILQAYVFLSPVDFLVRSGGMINAALQDQYADLQDEGVLMILRLVELLVRVGPPQVPTIFKPLILCSMRAILDGDDYPMLMTMHLAITSRLLVGHPNQFIEFSLNLAAETDKTQDEVAGRLLDVWLDKMSCVTQPDRKKLLSLALSSLLTSNSPVVVCSERIFGIFINVVETLNDVTRVEEEQNNRIVDTLVKTPTDLAAELGVDDQDFETEHDVRRRESLATDPIHTVDLRGYFQSQITALAGQIGQSKYTEIMTNVDTETMANMKEFVAL